MRENLLLRRLIAGSIRLMPDKRSDKNTQKHGLAASERHKNEWKNCQRWIGIVNTRQLVTAVIFIRCSNDMQSNCYWNKRIQLGAGASRVHAPIRGAWCTVRTWATNHENYLFGRSLLLLNVTLSDVVGSC